uniref:Uncharacterized protein n=1 Tax=Anopheles dirus TaxID=7168 RepID=A0A182NSP9_9DIPT
MAQMELGCFDQCTEDFLANGFYHLYTELQDDGDIATALSELTNSANELVIPPTVEPATYLEPVVSETPASSSNSLELIHSLDEVDGLQLELNVEDFILEYNCVNFSQLWENELRLPENTYLCDDSCEAFIRQSKPSEDPANVK